MLRNAFRASVNNDRGSALAELAITVSIMLVGFSAVSMAIDSVDRIRRVAELKDDVQRLAVKTFQGMSSRSACTQAIGDHQVFHPTSARGSLGLEISLQLADFRLAAGSPINGYPLRTKSVNLTEATLMGQDLMGRSVYRALVRTELEEINKEDRPIQFAPVGLSYAFFTVEDDRLVACAAVDEEDPQAMASTCAGLGGYFDDIANRCRFPFDPVASCDAAGGTHDGFDCQVPGSEVASTRGARRGPAGTR